MVVAAWCVRVCDFLWDGCHTMWHLICGYVACGTGVCWRRVIHPTTHPTSNPTALACTHARAQRPHPPHANARPCTTARTHARSLLPTSRRRNAKSAVVAAVTSAAANEGEPVVGVVPRRTQPFLQEVVTVKHGVLIDFHHLCVLGGRDVPASFIESWPKAPKPSTADDWVWRRWMK
jgi:hypothetical protein